MKEFNLSDVCFFDCETTGLPPKGAKWDVDFMQFPHIVQLAWSFGEKERSFIVLPDGWEIPAEAAEIHGVTIERAIAEGVPFAEIVEEFLADAADAQLICAHNIYFDTSMVKSNILRECGKEYYDEKAEDALFKGKRVDTMYKTIKFVGACYPNGRRGKFPKLEELYAKLFNNETFPAHDALEDVKALRRCVPELVKLGIIQLVQKEYPAEQLKTKPVKKEKKIEFKDNPVEVPGVDNKVKLEPKQEMPPKKGTAEKISEGMAKSRQMLDDNDF